MSSWQLIKALLHGIDFYWKKFIVLSLLLLTLGGGIWFWRANSITEAAFQFSDMPQYSTLGFKSTDITIQSNGKVIIDGKEDNKALKIYRDYYEIRLLAFDNPGVYIQNFIATMHLPKSVNENQIKQIVYAVHGTGAYQAYMADSRTLLYQVSDISSISTVTITAQLPKDILTPPLGKRLIYTLTSAPATSYLWVAMVLPLVTFISLFVMLIKRRKDQIISLKVPAKGELPDNSSPAVVGVLIDGQVSAREIAATLIDLACRGYIYITRKDNTFSFGKRKSLNLEELPELKPFERTLLSKIFSIGEYKSTKDDVEMRVGHHIFSRKIAQVYLGIYNEATRSGYFISNPAIVHKRWKYTGIALFFLSILGFIQSAVYAPDPKFTLIFWVGEMAASSVIVKMSGLMPTRSNYGSKILTSWMAFRKYLKAKEPIEPGLYYKGVYEKYLPYSIVFGVEVEWAKRFMAEPFTTPSWYQSTETITTLEEFVGGLFPLISYVGETLANSHDPSVE